MSTASDALALLEFSPLWGPLVKVAQGDLDLPPPPSPGGPLPRGVPEKLPGIEERLVEVGRVRPKKTEGMTQEEKRNIAKTLQLIKPRSKTEKQVEELAGRGLTPGQVARYMLIGGAMVGGLGVARRGIVEGGKLGLSRIGQLASREGAKKLVAPSAVGADALYGTAIGALPVLRRKMDIEAARRGQF